jgi:tetratricopeptide (TPR) repeat protein
MGWSWLLAASEGRAYSHFKLAAELNPHDSETLIASAMGMAFMGHMDLALEWSKSAMELNPVHPDYFLGYSGAILFLAKDYPAAANALHRCSDIFPDRMAWVAATFAKLGDAERAIDAYNRFLEIVTTKWEGATPPTHQEIHTWMLFKSTPMTWKEGRLNLKDGLELAHQLSVGKDKN